MLLRLFHKLQTVTKIKVDTVILIKHGGGLWEVLLTESYHPLIDLHHIDAPNSRIAGDLSGCSPVTATDNQHLFNAGISSESRMANHLMVSKFIFFGHHHEAIKGEKSPKGIALEKINPLIFGLFGYNMLLNLNGKTDILGMIFGVP